MIKQQPIFHIKALPKLALIASALLLGACSTTGDQYIENGDWYQLGVHDGQRGQEARSVSKLTSYGSADQGAYDDGYMQGIQEYCNPDHAYQIGLSGSDYQGMCENTPDGQKFRLEWQRGWRHYQSNNSF